MRRLIALIVLLIPVLLAAFGVKLMRDMTFGILHTPIPSLILQFVLGIILFVGGIAFISGFVLFRDRKRNRVQTRFQNERHLKR